MEVVGAAGFGASAREANAAKGLSADDGASDVAVDIDVAGVDAGGDAGDGGMDAAVNAKG